jgi:hypothetical protein
MLLETADVAMWISLKYGTAGKTARRGCGISAILLNYRTVPHFLIPMLLNVALNKKSPAETTAGLFYNYDQLGD